MFELNGYKVQLHHDSEEGWVAQIYRGDKLVKTCSDHPRSSAAEAWIEKQPGRDLPYASIITDRSWGTSVNLHGLTAGEFAQFPGRVERVTLAGITRWHRTLTLGGDTAHPLNFTVETAEQPRQVEARGAHILLADLQDAIDNLTDDFQDEHGNAYSRDEVEKAVAEWLIDFQRYLQDEAEALINTTEPWINIKGVRQRMPDYTTRDIKQEQADEWADRQGDEDRMAAHGIGDE